MRLAAELQKKTIVRRYILYLFLIAITTIVIIY